jgi:HEAT repeat protein
MRLFHIMVLSATLALPSAASSMSAQSPPADSVYTLGRRMLDDKNYDAAARVFDQLLQGYPRSVYAPDALYWKGFALYRNGSLDAAQTALEAQASRFPNAPTRADAAALLIQVKGELARRGDAAARRDVDSAASSSNACDDMEVRIAALDALQQMDSERVLPLLRRVMQRRDSCSERLRKNALFILAQKGGADRDKLLLEIAKGDPSSAVRNDAVFYLGQAKSDAAIDALEDVLNNADENGVRGNALFALAQMWNRSERAGRIVMQFAMKDAAPNNLRNDALFHVAQHPGPETNKWLVGVISNGQAPMELRKNAVFHLAQRKNGSSTDLADVYATTLPKEIKKDLLFHIAQRRDDASITRLIAIAKTDPVMELRKDALFYLSQSKDPKAMKAIEELLVP